MYELPLLGAPQEQWNWWTEGLGWARRALEARQQQTGELGWRLGRATQEGRKVKSIPPQPAAARKISRTAFPSLKPAGGFYFQSNFFSFNSFLLSFLLSFFYSFFPLLSFPLYIFSLPSFIYLIPTSETITPGTVKIPEMDPKRGSMTTLWVHLNSWDRETNFTLILKRNCKLLYICIIFSLFLYLSFF